MIQQVEEKDKNLVTRLEEAVCFGKIILVLKPLIS